jgi:deoxyadenosine/deoxycytidine kinase
MLNIQIDNPELERNIRQTYGEDTRSLAKAFAEFVQQQRIKQDIGVSIEQLDAGEEVPLEQAIADIRTKGESLRDD